MILKKWAYRVFFLGLISVICLSSCGDSSSTSTAVSSSVDNSAASSAATKTADEKNTIDPEKQKTIVEKWLDKNLEKGEKVSDSAVEDIRTQVTEDIFLEVWKKKTLDRWKDDSGDCSYWVPTVESKLEPSFQVYEKVWDKSSAIQSVRNDLSNAKQTYEQMLDIQKNSELVLGTDTPFATDDTLYVVKRMDDIDVKDALQSLWNQVTGEGATASYWLCTNVVYQYGTAFPGDNYYLIHSQYKDPFSGQGPCALSYVDLNTTVKLTDTNGFNYDVPVYELVNGDNFNSNLTNHNNLYAKSKEYCAQIQAFLEGEQSGNVVANTAAENQSEMGGESNQIKTADSSIYGVYYQEYLRAEIYAEVGHESSSDFDYLNMVFSYFSEAEPDEQVYYQLRTDDGKDWYGVDAKCHVYVSGNTLHIETPDGDYELEKMPEGTPMYVPSTGNVSTPQSVTSSNIINPDYMGDPGSYLCSWSSTEYMTEDQLQLLDYNGARIVKNEIFARHGRRFNDAELQAYFDEKSWYNGTINPDDFNDAILSDIEKANIDVIDGYMMKHAS